MHCRTSCSLQVVAIMPLLAGRCVASILDREPAFLDRVARYGAALDREQRRALRLAAVVGERAARMEGAARRRVDRTWHLACNRRALAASHLEIGDRVE